MNIKKAPQPFIRLGAFLQVAAINKFHFELFVNYHIACFNVVMYNSNKKFSKIVENKSHRRQDDRLHVSNYYWVKGVLTVSIWFNELNADGTTSENLATAESCMIVDSIISEDNFGVLFSNEIIKNFEINTKDIDLIYNFIYGQDIKTVTGCFYEPLHDSKYDRKEWKNSDINSINLDLFLSAFLTFIYSKTKIGVFWGAIEDIIRVLQKNDSDYWENITNNKGISTTNLKNEIINFIFDEIYKYVERNLQPDSCGRAVKMLRNMRFLFPDHLQKYKTLEKECCVFFTFLAKSRIDQNSEIILTNTSVGVNAIFFYDLYFDLGAIDANDKMYLYDKICEIYIKNAKHQINLSNFQEAFEWLKKAEEFIIFEKQKVIIYDMMKFLKKPLRKIKWTNKIESLIDNIKWYGSEFFDKAAKVALLLSIVFLILTLIGLLFSKIGRASCRERV